MGDGTKAIVIKNVKDDLECIRAENDYISKKLGMRGIDWEVVTQHFLRKDGKVYDEMEICVISTGKTKSFLFDVTIRFKGLI